MKQIIKITLLVLVVILFLKQPDSKLHNEIVADYNLEDHQTEIDGLTIYYQTAGNPKNPPFVTLHGWGGRHEKTFENRAKWMKSLAENGYFVVAPEHPGLIRSQTPPTSWSNLDFAQYVHVFLSQLGVEKPIIHGQSFGGMIALSYATQYPEDLKALVLTDTALPIYKNNGIYMEKTKPVGRLFSWSMRTKLLPSFLKKDLVLSVLSVPVDHQSSESFLDRAVMGEILSGDNNQGIDVAKITVPTFLFWGYKDWKTPVAIGRQLDQQIPNSTLTILDGGHTVMYSQIDTIITKIDTLEAN